MARARSFYICQNNTIPKPHGKSGMKNAVSRGGTSPDKKPVNKSDMILETRIKSLLDKYKGDPEIINEINGCLSMYECNRTIALELGRKKSVAELTKEFLNQLKQLEKREVKQK